MNTTNFSRLMQCCTLYIGSNILLSTLEFPIWNKLNTYFTFLVQFVVAQYISWYYILKYSNSVVCVCACTYVLVSTPVFAQRMWGKIQQLVFKNQSESINICTNDCYENRLKKLIDHSYRYCCSLFKKTLVNSKKTYRLSYQI